ncbi:multicopper oxidase family protein [Amorphus orientalis]|uniref:FtsP/CotA-like multicopper oxidase with cupredoxin domain n=1 Tax=Amorphus orientalis TaxID=649198 RepID=A0AAE4AUS2_9HYPH|nr:multicopper oxidase family protein [Amorphus orientalis]MDQ0317457.1 FtsP/CotA-like multicopper oxidase with cupredoxin domain [Amorphus orientalis]
MRITRRSFLRTSGLVAACGAGLGLAGRYGGALAEAPMDLTARRTSAVLDGSSLTEGVMTWNEGPLPPVIRVRQGAPFSARLVNALDEPTTIHWHGLRIPNAMDGVPFLTQPYVYEGDSFDYAFTPPDAGTFWYHPHCNTLTQLGHGLAGLFIVENPDDPVFDDEIALNIRDWRLDGKGRFIAQFKPRDAARSGTFGTVRTTNWTPEPIYDAPAGGLVRVRAAITDVTRICRFELEGADAKVIAIDGYPVPDPFAFDEITLGPGQRLDLVVRMPDEEGAIARLINERTTSPYAIAQFRAVGSSLNRDLREVTALPDNPVAEPDLDDATVLPLELSATAEEAPAKGSICGSLGYNFWAINKVPWSGDSADPHEPLYELKQGRSYVLDMVNRTPHLHPIHLHGLAFKPIRSSDGPVAPRYTDTYLINPDERVQLALKADNPGDWVFHCHIIEHQKTGMTGFFRVV